MAAACSPDRGAEIVRLAEAWIGTPYRHQASLRGVGTDCLGLIRGLWREVHGAEPEPLPPYSRDWGEASGQEVLMAALSRWFVPVEERGCAGDVLLFRMRQGAIAKHLGLLCAPEPGASFIHAYSGHAVLKTDLTASWARKVVARFRFP